MRNYFDNYVFFIPCSPEGLLSYIFLVFRGWGKVTAFGIFYIFLVQVIVKGYAVSGGGRGIERVDISLDGGKTWVEASRYQKPAVPYIADNDENSEKWAWVLFEAKFDISKNAEIVAKAVCNLYSVICLFIGTMLQFHVKPMKHINVELCLVVVSCRYIEFVFCFII